MKMIKELKKKSSEADVVKGVSDEIRKLSREIDDKKKVAQRTHKDLQDKAKESQIMHETLIEASKEIDGVKKEEEEAFKKFIEFKQDFNDTNTKLKTCLRELKEMNEISLKVGLAKEKTKKKKEAKTKAALKEKQKEVEEKLKKGAKLTTEDLIAMQSAEK